MLISSVMLMYLLLLISPGPDFFFVTQVAVSQNKQRAFIGALGITVGMSIWAVLSLFGLQALLLKYPLLERVITLCGGLYLCYIAAMLLRGVLSKSKTVEQAQQKEEKIVYKHVFLKGLLTNLSNPKVAVCFASIFSIFLAQKSNAVYFVLISMIIMTFIWFLFVAFVFSLSIIQKSYNKVSKYIDFFAFMLFTFFGLHLIFF